jgi:glycosyltransferase involved in cell wall biosynthesis
MIKTVTVVHYWAGCPKSVSSKWQRFLALVQRCSQESWNNYLVLSKMPEDTALSEPFEKAGCEIILQPRSNGNFDLGSVWRTYKLIRNLKCDVFHCHNDHTSPLIGAAIAKVPVRIWSTLAMSSYHENLTQPQGIHRLMPGIRLSNYCTHRILAISGEVRNELMDFGVSENQIEVVHGAVDLTRFASVTNCTLREELNLSSSDIVISSVGRAIHRKGWDIAIKAFAEVKKVIPNARLVLVGSTTSSEEKKIYQSLVELCRLYNISEYVHFLGHRNDLCEILKASDIFILPSRSEGLPGALLEAMSSGLPSIATNICGMTEVIKNGEDGFLFERENAKELTEYLLKLIEDKTLQRKISSQALNRVRQFSMEVYVEKVFNIYKSLLNTS